MALERTFSIVKPDGVARNLIGQVYTRVEAAGLKVVAAKLTHLSKTVAEGIPEGFHPVASAWVAPVGT